MASISRRSFFFILSAILGCVLIGPTVSTDHIVGGSTGWTVVSNSSFYEEWAQGRTFVVGDRLVFLFTSGIHNVVEVKEKSDLDGCTRASVMDEQFSGPTIVKLDSTGEHYFYCSIKEHCKAGQKLSITVAASDPTLVSSNSNHIISNLFRHYSSIGAGLLYMLLFT